jgi:transcriptional antiterminator NusG
MAKKWYIINAYSGFEKSVHRQLIERIERSGFSDLFGEILVPVEEIVDNKDGKKKISERKFFPGYVFIEMDMTDDSWHLVKSTPKVSGFIGGTATKPLPMRNNEMDAIRKQMQLGVEKPKSKLQFEIGESVRVLEGAFADYHGEVQDINYEKQIMHINIQIFGRETPVEVQFNQVEKS